MLKMFFSFYKPYKGLFFLDMFCTVLVAAVSFLLAGAKAGGSFLPLSLALAAALELVRKFNVKKVYINFIIELDFLNGRKAIGDDVEISSLLSC